MRELSFAAGARGRNGYQKANALCGGRLTLVLRLSDAQQDTVGTGTNLSHRSGMDAAPGNKSPPLGVGERI